MGTVVKSGPFASFTVPANSEMKHCKIHFSPKLNGSGNPAPDNMREMTAWDKVDIFAGRKNIGHLIGYSAQTISSLTEKRSLSNKYGTTISTVEPEKNLIITQSIYKDSSNLSYYTNGYFIILFDNLVFGRNYNISFKVTDIVNNPLNASLSNMKAVGPSGSGYVSGKVNGDVVTFKNISYNKYNVDNESRREFAFYNCGMSCTISDIIITPANDNNSYYEPYTTTRPVIWNQWAKPFTEENWRPHSSSTISVEFNDGVATCTWLKDAIGYASSLRSKVGIHQSNKQIWYVSYMVKPPEGMGAWGVEYNGGLQETAVTGAQPGVWTQCSRSNNYWRGTDNYLYYCYYRGTAEGKTGKSPQVKAPVAINLTQMFGPGLEPSKEEFEAQCVLNGIDLTEALTYDEGSAIDWKTQGEMLHNTVKFPVFGKNKFDIDATFAEPSNTELSYTEKRIFEPYTYCIGINVSNYYKASNVTDFSIVDDTITFTSSGTDYGVGYALPLPQGTYKVSYTGTNVRARFANYKNDGTFIYMTSDDSNNRLRIPIGSAISVLVFTPIAQNEVSTVSNIQVEDGTTATDYEAFDPTHSVYGGWVDLIEGKIHSGWEVKYIKDIEWEYKSGNKRFQVALPNEGLMDALSTGWTNCAIAEAYTTSISQGYGNNQIATYLNKHIYIRDDRFDNVEDFVAAMGETRIAYPIVNGQTYDIVPASYSTFMGANNVWSNADYVEVEYDLYETQEILTRKQFIIGNQPHTEIKSSSVGIAKTDVAAPLKNCTVQLVPIQDLNGYDSPWLAGCGKNLITPSIIPSMISSGIYTINNDESVTISGSDGRGWTDASFEGFPLNAGTYTLSWDANTAVNIATSDDEYTTVTRFAASPATFTLGNDGYVKWKFSASSYPITVKMQLQKGSTATVWTPYENICPINGMTNVTVYHYKTDYPITASPASYTSFGVKFRIDENGMVYAEGTPTSWATALVGHIAVNGDETLYLRIYGNLNNITSNKPQIKNSQGVTVKTDWNDKVLYGGADLSKYNDIKTVQITIKRSNNDIRMFGNCFCAISAGSPPDVAEYTSSWEDVAGTIYGGYVDLTNGKLIQTHKSVILNGSENWQNYATKHQMHFALTIQDKKIGYKKTICDCFPNVANAYFWDQELYGQFGDHGNLRNIYVNAPYKMPGLLTEWKAYLAEHPMHIVYELETPIEYSIDPVSIKLLRGINDVWSNSYGDISIQYWTH